MAFSFDQENKIHLLGSMDFTDLPHALLATTEAGRVKYNPVPGDKGLLQLLSPFMSKDGLRPGMTGVFFQGKECVATNGHTLVTLPGVHKPAMYNSTIAGKLLDERFPDYENALWIPQKSHDRYTIDCRALRSFLGAAKHFANKLTKAVSLKTEQSVVTFSYDMLIDDLLFFEKQGFDKVLMIVDPTRQSVIMCPKNYGGPREQPVILQMQIPIYESPEYQQAPYVTDDEEKRELFAYWSLPLNCVVDRYGKYHSPIDDSWSHKKQPSDLFPDAVWKALKLAADGSVIPIAENVCKLDDKLIATDVQRVHYVYTHDSLKRIPDGIYRMVKKALLPSGDHPHDFPHTKDLDYSKLQQFPGVRVVLTGDPFKQLAPWLSKDDLRPAMTGCFIEPDLDGSGYGTLVATNGHGLYTKRLDFITKFATPPPNITDLEWRTKCKYGAILPAPFFGLHAVLQTGLTSIEYGYGAARGIADYGTNGKVYTRLVDELFPEYANAIPHQFEQRLLLNKAAWVKAMAKLPKIEKGQTITIQLFNGGAEARILEDHYSGYNNRVVDQKLIALVPLENASYDLVDEAVKLYADGLLLMPVSPENAGRVDQDGRIAFNWKYFNTALATVGSDSRLTIATTDYMHGAFFYEQSGVHSAAQATKKKKPSKPIVIPEPPKPTGEPPVKIIKPSQAPSIAIRARALVVLLRLRDR